MFNINKLKDAFTSTKKKDEKILNLEDEITTAIPNIKYTMIGASNCVYTCALAAKISHGFDLDPHYVKQYEFVNRLMGYGHDSISAHSNLQFIVYFKENNGSIFSDLTPILPGLKYMSIAPLNWNDMGTKYRGLVFGATIRAMRYFLKNVTEPCDMLDIVKDICYKNTAACFYPDFIEAGIMDKDKFTYIPEFANADVDADEEDQLSEEDLITHMVTQVTSDNVTLIDYTLNLNSKIKSLQLLVNDDSEEMYQKICDALIKTSFATFRIKDFSRSISQQINRHDFGITQMSQRYVDYSNSTFIDPIKFNPSKYPDLNKEYEVVLSNNEIPFTISGTSQELGDMLMKIYPQLLDQGMLKQDARSFIPMNSNTDAYYTSTLENLIHFINVREDKASQPEVQEIAHTLRGLVERILIQDNEYIESKFVLPKEEE